MYKSEPEPETMVEQPNHGNRTKNIKLNLSKVFRESRVLKIPGVWGKGIDGRGTGWNCVPLPLTKGTRVFQGYAKGIYFN